MSMQVDRINQQRIFWSGKYVNPNSKEYKTLEGESNYAVSCKRIFHFVHFCARKYFTLCILMQEKLFDHARILKRNIKKI